MRDNPDRPELPLVLQHAVAAILEQGRVQDISSAFAIATSSLQRAGILIPGTRTLSAYGMRVERVHQQEPLAERTAKKRVYERALGRENADDQIYLLIEDD